MYVVACNGDIIVYIYIMESTRVLPGETGDLLLKNGHGDLNIKPGDLDVIYDS